MRKEFTYQQFTGIRWKSGSRSGRSLASICLGINIRSLLLKHLIGGASNGCILEKRFLCLKAPFSKWGLGVPRISQDMELRSCRIIIGLVYPT